METKRTLESSSKKPIENPANRKAGVLEGADLISRNKGNDKQMDEEDRTLISKISKKPPPIKLKRQKRVEKKPTIFSPKEMSRERIEQETKLVVLEYLSSHSPERISSRSETEHRGRASVFKARTIHSSERPFLDIIERRNKGKVVRSNSEEYDAKVREKLIKMARPLRRQLTPDILDDIKSFDKETLKKGQKTVGKRDRIPCLRLALSEKNDSLDSPITVVTERLDIMSKDIMKDYPQLLDEHLIEILTPLEAHKKLTYEEFSAVAKSVFEKQLARFTGSIWTKVALVFYLVKEVLYSGILTDFQVELIVNYATRFITETSGDKIKKQGGWVALESGNNGLLEEDLFHQDIYNPLGHNSNQQESLDKDSSAGENLPETDPLPGYLDQAKWAGKKLSTYAAALLAVGIGFAYAYLKQH